MDFGILAGAIGKGVLEVLLPSIASVAGVQLTRLLNRHLKKAGLELDEAQQEKLRQVIVDSVTRAEEMGRRENLTGPQKRTAATDAALLELRHTFPNDEEFTRERVGKMIDTVLPAVRPLISEPAPAPATSV